MQRLFVPLSPEALRRILELAQEERRRPQDQAAILLEDALAQRNTEAKDAPRSGQGRVRYA